MKCQVLLCGTQYGQVYLPTIFESQEFELAALLAKGSSQSQRLSQQTGVTLYKDVTAVEEDIDLACVAIGGEAGTMIAKTLLEKRIPVLIEHPRSIADITLLLASALVNNTEFHINSHFSYIAPIADFIMLCQKLNSYSKAHIITVSCNSRTLFSAIDILMRAFGIFDLKNMQIHPINTSESYQQFNFLIGDIPCNIIYQRWRGKEDNSKDSPLGHQFTITYPVGVLSLGSTFGPCLWFPLSAGGVPPHITLFSNLQNQNSAMPTQTDMVRWRKIANHKSLIDLWNAKQYSYFPEHQNTHFLSQLCNNWSALFNENITNIQHDVPSSIGEHLWTANSIMNR